MDWKAILKDVKEDERLRELGYPVEEKPPQEKREKEEKPKTYPHSKWHLLARNLFNDTEIAPDKNYFLIKHNDLPHLGQNYGNGVLIHKTEMNRLFNRILLQKLEPDNNSEFITDLLNESTQTDGSINLPDIVAPDIELFRKDEAGNILYKSLKQIDSDITAESFLHFLDTYLEFIENEVRTGKFLKLNIDPELSEGFKRRKDRIAAGSKRIEPRGLPFDVQDLLDFNEKILPELIEIIRDNLYVTNNRILPRFTRKYKTYMSRDVNAQRLFPILAKIMKGQSLVGKVEFDDKTIKETENEIKEILNDTVGSRTIYSYLLEAHTKAYPSKGIKSLLTRKKSSEEDERKRFIIEERQRDLVLNLDNAVKRDDHSRTVHFQEQMEINWKEFGDVKGGNPYKVMFGDDEVPEIETETMDIISDTALGSREKTLRNMGKELEKLGASFEEE
tara:strand:+ start:702 stop:2042 length:1341 start_codon:yes stop_codon:yes gene_type:complete